MNENYMFPIVQYELTEENINVNDFAFNFPINNNDDIVILTNEGENITNYSINQEENNKYISLYDFFTIGTIITIYRKLILGRITNFYSHNSVGFNDLNDEFDNIQKQIAKISLDLYRSIKLPIYEAILDSDLPKIKIRANKLLGFDENGRLKITDHNMNNNLVLDEINEKIAKLEEDILKNAATSSSIETNEGEKFTDNNVNYVTAEFVNSTFANKNFSNINEDAFSNKIFGLLNEDNTFLRNNLNNVNEDSFMEKVLQTLNRIDLGTVYIKNDFSNANVASLTRDDSLFSEAVSIAPAIINIENRIDGFNERVEQLAHLDSGRSSTNMTTLFTVSTTFWGGTQVSKYHYGRIALSTPISDYKYLLTRTRGKSWETFLINIDGNNIVLGETLNLINKEPLCAGFLVDNDTEVVVQVGNVTSSDIGTGIGDGEEIFRCVGVR